MTIYVAYWNDGEEYIADKGFLDEGAASEYVKHKNETTEYGWIKEPLEVIE